MAYTIKSQPTSPNATYTSLIYNVSSSNALNPQYNYIMDVYPSGSADRLARIRQFPNPVNEAVFDPSRIFNDNLQYLKDFSDPGYSLNSTQHVRTFSVEFGEEYGTSSSSSLAVTASIAQDFIEVFPGQIDPNNGTSFNWPDSGSSIFLTDRPSGVKEYVGARYRMPFYNGTGSFVLATAQVDGGSPTTLGISANQFFSSGAWINPIDGQTLTYTYNGVTNSRTFEDACNYPVYNFMFINKYGMYENFSTALPVRGNTSVDKQNYNQSFVDYSNQGAYDVKRRGETNYNNNLTDNLTISTDWLSKDEAVWLTQMIESDSVFVAVSPDNTVFKPIVITNAC